MTETDSASKSLGKWTVHLGACLLTCSCNLKHNNITAKTTDMQINMIGIVIQYINRRFQAG